MSGRSDHAVAQDDPIRELTGPPPPGAIVAFGGTTAPSGWLLCQGQEVSRAEHAALFAAIGTTYGEGNGATTFNLPDLRGRVPAGEDQTANRLAANDDLGEAAGEERHQLAQAEMPPHAHGLRGNSPYGGGGNRRWKIEAAVPFGENSQDLVQLDGPIFQQYATEETGGGQPHNNMPPYLIVNYLIKT